MQEPKFTNEHNEHNGDNLAFSLGISKERDMELCELCLPIINEESLNKKQKLQMCLELAESTNEQVYLAFQVGYMLGVASERSKYFIISTKN